MRTYVQLCWYQLGLWANDYVKIARVLTTSFVLSPRVLHKQHPCSPGHYQWEVLLHVKRERVRVEMDRGCDVIKICVRCSIVHWRLHVTRRKFCVYRVSSRNAVTWTFQQELRTKTDEKITASFIPKSLLRCAKISLCNGRPLLFTNVAPNVGMDAPVCQCSRYDMKQNLKAYTNVTCSELAPLNVMLHAHVYVLRVSKPLYYPLILQCG